LEPYWKYRERLSIVDHFILYNERVLIPPSLRPEICRNLTTGMLERAKVTVFWPGMKRSFATFGVPYELSSDGGPEFIAKETADFLKRWGVEHRLSSAYHPRSNGYTKVAVKAMKRLLRDVSLNGEIDSESYTRAILQFRNTPDPSSKLYRLTSYFGRPLRDVLPIKPPMQSFHCDIVKQLWRNLWKSREETLRMRSTKQLDTLSLSVS